MSGQRLSRQRRGFTTVELIAAVAVLGLVMAIVGYRYWSTLDAGRTREAILEIHELQTLVDNHAMATGSLPASLAAVGKGGALDPWDNPYVYTVLEGASPSQIRKDGNLNPLNTGYDLYSKGKDGTSNSSLNAGASQDDIVRANDGAFVGLGRDY